MNRKETRDAALHTFIAERAQLRALELHEEMVGKTYVHFKEGAEYLVIDVSVDEKTFQPRVSYAHIANGWRWNRLYCEWIEEQDTPGGRVPRFRRKD